MQNDRALAIIHMLPELQDGGVERLVPIYANLQAEAGHKVFVISGGGKLVSLLSDKVKHVAMPVYRKNFFVGMECARKIAKIIRDENIDIVHAHSRVPAWVAFFARRFAGRSKFVYTAHARYSSTYSLWPLRRSDGVICVSEVVQSHIADWLPKSKPAKVIYNTLPREVVSWKGSGGVKKRLLFLGRISERKGVVFLLEVLSRLKDRDWVFDMIGDGPETARVKEAIERLGLSERARLLGFSDRAPEMIAECDLMLFASLPDEGMPLTLMEALKAGAPVIASDIPAVREVVESDDDGKDFIAPNDLTSWVSAVGEFLDGKRDAKLALKVDIPSKEGMVAQIIDFYREVLVTD